MNRIKRKISLGLVATALAIGALQSCGSSNRPAPAAPAKFTIVGAGN